MDVEIAASNDFWCVGRHVHVIIQVHTIVFYLINVLDECTTNTNAKFVN